MITTNRKQKNGRMYKIKLYAICCITYWTFFFNFNAMEDEVYDTSKNLKHLILYCPYSKRGK